MDEEHSRVATGVLCLQCGAEIFERRLRDGDGFDHWYDVDGPKVVRLTPGEWRGGRDPECSIVVRDFGCSRRHAKLVVHAGGVQIVDVKSKGGTQVNRRSVVEASLQSGDDILLGTMPFRFLEGAEPARRPVTAPEAPVVTSPR